MVDLHIHCRQWGIENLHGDTICMGHGIYSTILCYMQTLLHDNILFYTLLYLILTSNNFTISTSSRFPISLIECFLILTHQCPMLLVQDMPLQLRCQRIQRHQGSLFCLDDLLGIPKRVTQAIRSLMNQMLCLFITIHQHIQIHMQVISMLQRL